MSQDCVSVFFDEMDHEFESLSIDTIELFNVCDEIERNDLNHPFYDQRMMVLCDEFDGKLVDQMGRGTKRKAAVDINSADIKRIKSGSNMDLSRSSQEQSTSNEEDFKRLTKKGLFPYEFIKDFDTLNYNQLPDLPHFYSSLTDSIISNEDYNHAKDVWNHFNCKNMLDYSNLYLKTDVLLLADIFENFRRVCIKTYDLDPAHYYTAPGLSWDAMLKHTKTEIELLSDIDMIAFIKSGIRGGVSQCSTRYAKANNVYMSDYNAKDKESFLMYFDANNLYGWAMSQYLPTGGFEWVSADTDFNVSCSSDIGFILEVDLEYPVDLHEKHSDLPLCPENIPVGDAKEIRLIPNLKNKSKYIIHYRNLIQCLKMGLKLLKVYRILKFKQSPWLKNYIDLNTQLRTRANSDFEKRFL
ncbi:unnamed protein product [Pieris macdunnoughi]|uniref:DNA-directed DNA polymerase n=1 Tax=Pieris macdunnoughi TaxID=345717 RepID=A0A821X715_9NEOP|nr:unnamed protein product [Pieris macdunnoughi]